MVLHRLQPGDDPDDQSLGREVPFGADRSRLGLAESAESPLLDEVGHNDYPVVSHTIVLEQRARHRVAVREHSFREPICDDVRKPILATVTAIVPPPPAGDERNPRDRGPGRDKHVHVDVVRVHNVEPALAQQTSECDTLPYSVRAVKIAKRKPHHVHPGGLATLTQRTTLVMDDREFELAA